MELHALPNELGAHRTIDAWLIGPVQKDFGVKYTRYGPLQLPSQGRLNGVNHD
jgi:hypothetical protein